MRETCVQVNSLVKRYGEFVAVDHFSLNVGRGEILGLLGPNGSGKTTTINCILALLSYDRGSITIFGENMTPERYDIKRRIGVVPQNVAVMDSLTVEENIDFFCGLYVMNRSSRRACVRDALAFTGLTDCRNRNRRNCQAAFSGD